VPSQTGKQSVRSAHPKLSTAFMSQNMPPSLDGPLSLHVGPTATLALHCGNGFDADFSPIKASV